MILSEPTELLWAFIGLILTIIGTHVGASIAAPPWAWFQSGIHVHSLGVSYQIGAVLLIGCLGGRNSAALSQIAYLFLGLLDFPVFTNGGGLDYYQEPTFGYLLGFVPGAWVCGWLAFQASPKIESLAFSSLCGLLSIHVCGLFYAALGYAFGWLEATVSLPIFVLKYSIYLFPSQLAIVCGLAIFAYLIRKALFY